MINRRGLLAGAGALGAGVAGPARAGARRPEPLADAFGVVCESPDAQRVFCYTPGLCVLDSSRLIATCDLGGPGADRTRRGRVYTSDDDGETWELRAEDPMQHARPFVAGGAVYKLGHDGRILVSRSVDDGLTWSPAGPLTDSTGWHQSACAVWTTGTHVYLVMERNTDPSYRAWGVSRLAPVMLRGALGDDLTRREAWTFSNELSFRDAVAQVGTPRMIGMPFYEPGTPAPGRGMAEPGWLETNVVRFDDPDHLWHDPTGRTFHLLMRAHTGSVGLACLAKCVEGDDGALTVGTEQAPSGEPMLYVPMPGGQMRFHVLFDPPSGLFWLVSTQATDSMTRPDRLGPDRYNLPNNERQRLALHYSRNGIDWCWAGLICTGGSPRQARHYAAAAVAGDDLLVLSRSGDARARSAHDGNLITFHRIRGFRALAG